MLLGVHQLDSIFKMESNCSVSRINKKPPKSYENLIGHGNGIGDDAEIKNGLFDDDGDEYGSETAMMIGWLTFGRNFFLE
jgi:hypothetical protein